MNGGLHESTSHLGSTSTVELHYHANQKKGRTFKWLIVTSNASYTTSLTALFATFFATFFATVFAASAPDAEVHLRKRT